MPVSLTAFAAEARPIRLVGKGGLDAAGLTPAERRWVDAAGFNGETGKTVMLPAGDGSVAGAIGGLGEKESPWAPLAAGALAKVLPAGPWRLEGDLDAPDLAALGLVLGGYAFTRYGAKSGPALDLVTPSGVDARRVRRLADGVFLARDLINTAANDMGPAALEAAARELAARHGASVAVIAGDDLLAANFPMIHAVGRAAAEAPRLIDLTWGREDAPKVTLVGKGVCFDTGGLDIKPSAGMLLMKKDMGGAANVLGLASMLMAGLANVRLRVLIPAVENAIAGNAFRPGDVLPSRKGPTVEIGNTDAEGRLILADALALADEEAPALLVDMATLTGAARVALGPDLPPFFTPDEDLARDIQAASAAVADPLWRLPLWQPYDGRFPSRIADFNNVNTDGFAGSIIAALFLKRFVDKTASWAHFDIFAWNPVDRPHGPLGGEAQGIRALERVITGRFGLSA